MDAQPVTRAELVEALAETKRDIVEAVTPTVTKAVIDAVTSIVTEAIRASEERMIEAARGMQTEILNSFIPARAAMESRLSTTDQEITSVKTRLALLEGRLTQIEARLFKQPPAA